MDVERTMEFILDQQAKFWAAVQEMREQQAAMQKDRAAMQKDQAAMQQDHADLRSLVVRLAEHQLGLAQHFDQFQQETRAALVAVAEAQQHTDERLNALIAVVDGVVRRLPQQ